MCVYIYINMCVYIYIYIYIYIYRNTLTLAELTTKLKSTHDSCLIVHLLTYRAFEEYYHDYSAPLTRQLLMNAETYRGLLPKKFD